MFRNDEDKINKMLKIDVGMGNEERHFLIGMGEKKKR